MNSFFGKKVLITGHTGFKGFWLAMILRSMGANVVGVSLKTDPNKKSHFNILNGEDLIKTFFLDIKDLHSLKELTNQIKPDYIFHLAAQALVAESFKDPINTFTTNTIGSINLLESMRDANYKSNLIMITSDKVYENVEWVFGYRENDTLGGSDPYSASKACAELSIRSYFKSYLRNSNIRLCIARAGNVIGGGDWSENRLIPDCIKFWSKKKRVPIRNSNATRPWQHVLDVINGYVSLAMKIKKNKNLHGEEFNFGPNNKNFKVIDVLYKSRKIWPSIKWRLTNNKIFFENTLLSLNSSKARKKLKWYPRLNIDKSIMFTINWYKFYLKNKKKKNKILQESINQIKYFIQI